MKTMQTLKDVLTMSGRYLLLSKRDPDTILTSIIAPILTILLFAYATGGTMQAGETSCVNFTVPGITLQRLRQCVATTAIAVCSNIRSGIMGRFCTMPVKHSSILNGHVQGAFIRNMVTALLILLVAFPIGFRPEADLLSRCAALLIISLYILTLSRISVYFGMITNSLGGADSFSILAIALPCISSGFVPIGTIPKALQVFVEYQPTTPVIDSLCALPLNESLKTCTLPSAILWYTVLLLLFYILSVRALKKKSNH